jgi:hypothetical protein
MADKTLTSMQRGALLLLLAKAGKVDNSDLRANHGLSIDGDLHKYLLGEGLAISDKNSKQAYIHTLTPAGIERAQDEMNADFAVEGTTPKIAAVALKIIVGFIAERYPHPIDFFTNVRTGLPPAEPPTTNIASDPAGDLEDRIRSAYRSSAHHPRQAVLLSRLRPLVRGTRQDVDDALIRMYRARLVNLMPEENQKNLKPADLEAAIDVGGQIKHKLSIGDS